MSPSSVKARVNRSPILTSTMTSSLLADFDVALHSKILNPITRELLFLQPAHNPQLSQQCFQPKRLPLRAHSSDLLWTSVAWLSILKPGLIHQAAEAISVHLGD